MQVHFLLHVPFETPGKLIPFFKEKANLSFTRFFARDPLPRADDFDLLVVMGGPMSVHDQSQYPWLNAEKQLIEQAIDKRKKVLGICLGAQLVADVLGARVYKNKFREIGWFEIFRAPEIADTALGNIWPQKTMAFHWHGEMFDIPRGARRLAFSQACPNQGFVFENRVIGLQFHLEVTPELIEGLLTNCADELDGSAFVQSANEIRKNMKLCEPANELMKKVVQQLSL